MSQPKPPLTRAEKNDLLLMGERGGFTLEKAARVLGYSRGERLKDLIERESDEFIAAMDKAFPGHFSDEDKEDWGPRLIAYKDLGRIRMPDTLISRVICKPWDRRLELSHGA